MPSSRALSVLLLTFPVASKKTKKLAMAVIYFCSILLLAVRINAVIYDDTYMTTDTFSIVSSTRSCENRRRQGLISFPHSP